MADTGAYVTPRVVDGTRLRLPASGLRDVEGRGYKGRVRDPNTGQHYDIFGAACQLADCYCDAVAVPVAGPDVPRAEEPNETRIASRRQR